LERSFPEKANAAVGGDSGFWALAEEPEVRDEPRRHVSFRLASAVAAALWLGTGLAQAAVAADSEICSKESPLGGWVRTQILEQKRETGQNGCDQVTNAFMTFDLVASGPSIEWLMAHAGSNVSPAMREQMLSAMLRLHPFGGRHATKLRYKIWSDGCHDIGGDKYTCSAPGGTASGELTLGEETPTGFKQIPQQTRGGELYEVIFTPTAPSLEIRTMLGGASLLHQEGSVCVGKSGYGNSGFTPISGGFAALSVMIEPEPTCNLGGDSAQVGDRMFMRFCTPATACFKPTDQAQIRQCAINPGKFAAIPFEGNAEHQSPNTFGGLVSQKSSWKLCCGCGQEPPPPDFPNESKSAQSTEPAMATRSTTWTITNDTAANWTLHSASLAYGVWKSSPPQTIGNGAKVSFTAESHDPMTGDQGSVVYTLVLAPTMPLTNFVFNFDNPYIGTDSYTVLVPGPFSEQTTQQTGNSQVLTSTVK
jgi:hypothetical protein